MEDPPLIDREPSGGHPGRSTVHLKLVLTAIFWGGTFVAGRLVSQELPPFTAAFLRFTVACLVLAAFLWREHGRIPRLPPGHLPVAALLGLTGVFAYNALFFLGLKTVLAGRASLIIALNPVLIALFSAWLLGEGMGLRKGVGIGLSVLGALVVISRGSPFAVLHGGLSRGDLYILGCVASWVSYSVIGKIAMREVRPLVLVAYACAIGTVFLGVTAAAAEGLPGALASASWRTWASLVYLGLFGTALGFIWYYEGIRAIGASRAGVFISLVPVSGVLLGALVLGERLDPSVLAGGALVVAGVYLTNRPKAERGKASREPPGPAVVPKDWPASRETRRTEAR